MKRHYITYEIMGKDAGEVVDKLNALEGTKLIQLIRGKKFVNDTYRWEAIVEK